MTDERQQAEAALRAEGLTPERCGEVDWELAIREQMDRAASRASTPLASIRSKLSTTLTEHSDSLPAPVLPQRTDYLCPRCEDAGWVLTRTDGGIRRDPTPCPGCVPIEVRLRLAGIEERHINARIETFATRDGNASAIAVARAWRMSGPSSIVLHARGYPGDSDWGTGKTYIATAMIVHRVQLGYPARVLSMQDFLEDMKRRFDDEGESAQVYADRIAAEPLLLLDDLGKEQPTPWSQGQVYRLINARWKAALPTIVTTNFHNPDDLAAVVGGATASRLRDFHWVPVGGTDMRGQ